VPGLQQQEVARASEQIAAEPSFAERGISDHLGVTVFADELARRRQKKRAVSKAGATGRAFSLDF